MITQSDSGVTCRCMCKKPRWACGACGMLSTRKGNVQRHIERAHNGNAEPMSYVQFLADLSAGKRAIASKTVHPSVLQSKWERMTAVIDRHEEQRLQDLWHSYSQLHVPTIIVRGDVCETCMSLSAEIIDMQKGEVPIISHECDLKWVTDNAPILKDKVVVRKYLEGKLGEHLLKLLESFSMGFYYTLEVVPDKRLDNVRGLRGKFELYKSWKKPGNDNRAKSELFIEEYKKSEEALERLLESNNPIPLLSDYLSRLERLSAMNKGIISRVDAISVLNDLKQNSGFYKVQYPTGARYFNISLV